MTRKEAKEELIQSLTDNHIPDPEAVEMAIKALKQEPCVVNLEVCKMREATQEEREGIDQYIDSIAESCEDAMSRILKRMWNCGGKHITNIDKVKMEQILCDELSLVKPQYTEDEIQKMQDLEQAELEKAYELGKAEGQKSEDAISRQAALGCCRNEWEEDIAKAFQFGLVLGFGKRYDEMDRVIDEIKKVITPQPKTGHWIKKDGYSDCSECGSHIVTEWDYCPKCGA